MQVKNAKVGLPSLEERGERGGVIAVFWEVIEIDKNDREDMCVWNVRSNKQGWTW